MGVGLGWLGALEVGERDDGYGTRVAVGGCRCGGRTAALNSARSTSSARSCGASSRAVRRARIWRGAWASLSHVSLLLNGHRVPITTRAAERIRALQRDRGLVP